MGSFSSSSCSRRRSCSVGCRDHSRERAALCPASPPCLQPQRSFTPSATMACSPGDQENNLMLLVLSCHVSLSLLPLCCSLRLQMLLTPHPLCWCGPTWILRMLIIPGKQFPRRLLCLHFICSNSCCLCLSDMFLSRFSALVHPSRPPVLTPPRRARLLSCPPLAALLSLWHLPRIPRGSRVVSLC